MSKLSAIRNMCPETKIYISPILGTVDYGECEYGGCDYGECEYSRCVSVRVWPIG